MRTTRLLTALAVTGALVVPTIGAVQAAGAASTPMLVGISGYHYPGHDRVVFQFKGGLPSTHKVSYVSKLVSDPKGTTMQVPGRALLRVRFFAANAHNANGPTVPARTAYDLPNVITTVRAGDFEAVTTYGIGLAKRTEVHGFVLPKVNRYVVDIRAAFGTKTEKVWFFNSKRFNANTRPFFTPVTRELRLGAYNGALDRLFAGPTPAEKAAGLRLLRSKASGFLPVDVAAGIARVQLTGGCSSGGSTVTIANEIMPTLRQFGAVDWVKIYDPAGTTEHPTGNVDSIPVSLEP